MEQKKTRVVRIHEEYRKKKESEAFEAAFGAANGDGGLTQEDRAVLAEAAAVLREGGLVAFPTETVYGLGANALDETAARRIYEAKGRPSDNPLIAHIADFEALAPLTAEIPEAGRKLAEAFWPGPLTMVFKKSGVVPHGTTGGLETVAVRMPSDPVARELIRLAGVPIAAPSANTSGRPSPTRAEHVLQDMDGKIEMIVDGGPVGIGVESTIVDVTEEIPTLLRPGAVTMEMLRSVVGETAVDPAITGPMRADIKPKAPGMKYRHYAPKADLTLVEGETDAVVSRINALAAEKLGAGQRVGIICTEETKDRYPAGILKSIGMRANEATVAHNLYAVLRELSDRRSGAGNYEPLKQGRRIPQDSGVGRSEDRGEMPGKFRGQTPAAVSQTGRRREEKWSRQQKSGGTFISQKSVRIISHGMSILWGLPSWQPCVQRIPAPRWGPALSAATIKFCPWGTTGFPSGAPTTSFRGERSMRQTIHTTLNTSTRPTAS